MSDALNLEEIGAAAERIANGPNCPHGSCSCPDAREYRRDASAVARAVPELISLARRAELLEESNRQFVADLAAIGHDDD